MTNKPPLPAPSGSDVTSASALRWCVVGLTVATIAVAWPLWPPLVLAAWTASLSRPLLARVERALHGRRRAAGVLALLLFLVLAVPLVVVVLGVVSGGQELLQMLVKASSAKGALQVIAAGPDVAPLPHFPTTLPEAFEAAERYGAQGIDVLTNVAGAAATGVVGMAIYFGGAYAFLVDGPTAWRWVERHSPLAPAHLARFGAAFRETGHGLLIGVGLTSATQGLVATIIYLVLGVPRWWVLGPVTGLASMIPFVGSALVWGPVAAGFVLTDHLGKAVILIALGIVVIGSVDNVLHPIFARMGALNMPMFVLFVALLGGLAAFGTWGAILGPLVVRLWMEALALRKEAATPAPPV